MYFGLPNGENGVVSTASFPYFTHLPAEIQQKIISYSDLLDVLLSYSQVCKGFRKTFDKDYVVGREDYRQLIVKLSNQYEPFRLFSLWFVNCMFKTVHDLVYYRYEIGGLDTMNKSWMMMIYQGPTSHHLYPPKLVLQSAKLHFEKYKKLTISQSLTVRDLVHLCDILLEDDSLVEPVFINLTLNRRSDSRACWRVFRACKHSAKILKAVLKSGHHFHWAQLMTATEPLSADFVTLLTEYNNTKGLFGVQVPFSAQNIRDNADMLLPSGTFVDYELFSRVVKAFSEVGYKGLPSGGVDYDRFIKYLMAHADLLSVDEFARFLQYVKKEKLVGWESNKDQSGSII
jgi:hypothetical protein